MGRHDNEDQDNVPKIGDGHHHANHIPEGDNSIHL